MWGQPKAAPASEVPASYVPVSRKRWLLAIYMDYVVFGAVWELIVHLVAPGREFTALRYLTFALLEAMLLGLFRWSPGEYLLSITFPRHPYDPIAAEGAEPDKRGRRTRVVESPFNPTGQSSLTDFVSVSERITVTFRLVPGRVRPKVDRRRG